MGKSGNYSTIHHICGISRKKEGYNVNHEKNKVVISKAKHDAFNTLFANGLPHEQLLIRYNLNKSVLSKQVKTELEKLIVMNAKYFYSNKIYNKG